MLLSRSFASSMRSVLLQPFVSYHAVRRSLQHRIAHARSIRAAIESNLNAPTGRLGDVGHAETNHSPCRIPRSLVPGWFDDLDLEFLPISRTPDRVIAGHSRGGSKVLLPISDIFSSFSGVVAVNGRSGRSRKEAVSITGPSDWVRGKDPARPGHEVGGEWRCCRVPRRFRGRSRFFAFSGTFA